MKLPTKNSVIEAYERIKESVVRTPAIENQQINNELGSRVFFKCENLQHIGAFKARGAINNALQLSKDKLKAGLITYSSGNHAQALAWAANELGTTATICMPTDAPAIKVAGVKRLGATVVFAGTTSDHRKSKALELQEQTNATLIEPFDHSMTIAGQGTATLEFIAQLKSQDIVLDTLYVPVGGGGLMAGACLATEGSDIQIIGVEPVGCDSLHQSLLQGSRVPVQPAPTLGDGLKPVCIGEINYLICKDRVSNTVQVNDDDMLEAMSELALKAKLFSEPSGAAAYVAAKQHPHKEQCIGVIISGGNADPATLINSLAL